MRGFTGVKIVRFGGIAALVLAPTVVLLACGGGTRGAPVPNSVASASPSVDAAEIVDAQPPREAEAERDAGPLGACFAELGGIVAEYETHVGATDQQLLSTSRRFSAARDRCIVGTTLSNRAVEDDPRYKPLWNRLAPIRVRIREICQSLDERLDALTQQFERADGSSRSLGETETITAEKRKWNCD